MAAFNEATRKCMFSISLPFLGSSEIIFFYDFLLQRTGGVFEASVHSADGCNNVV